jgi:hypothetical protein
MTGPSPIQVTLIRALSKNGSLQPAPYRRHRFPQRYTSSGLNKARHRR